jgi:acyl-CoA thioesterase
MTALIYEYFRFVNSTMPSAGHRAEAFRCAFRHESRPTIDFFNMDGLQMASRQPPTLILRDTHMADDDRSALLAEFMRRESRGEIRFWSTLGMTLIEAGGGRASVRLPFGPHLANGADVMHGGAVFAAADAATGVAAMGLLASGETLTTIEMKINFIRPVPDGEIVADALILHRGRSTAVGEADVRDAEGRLVAKALATYAILRQAQD